jgi:hypothetical protein
MVELERNDKHKKHSKKSKKNKKAAEEPLPVSPPVVSNATVAAVSLPLAPSAPAVAGKSKSSLVDAKDVNADPPLTNAGK